jgi:hypothetical protein
VLLEGADVLGVAVLGDGEIGGFEVVDGVVVCVGYDDVFDD